jgi:hypothetical protein
MTDPATLRAGLVAALSTISGYQVSGYWLSNPTPPGMHVFPDAVTYDLAGSRGADEWVWFVQAFVSLNIDKAAQMRLDELLASSGAMSVKAAVEADVTLGGACDDLRVIDAKGHQIFDVPGRGVMLGSTWTVHMLASGT